MPAAAHAHGFGRLYNLPVPFWLYAWGAAGALLVSFLIVGYFVSESAGVTGSRSESPELGRARWLAPLRWLSLAALALCIATALFGNPDPYRNFSMTAFWVVFLLGFMYLTIFAGDLFAEVNPWRTLARALDRLAAGFTRGRIAYPERLGYWPALGLYMALVAFELFGFGKTFSLGVALVGYSGITLGGVWLFGATAWFRYGELFSVLLRLVALAAPLEYVDGPDRMVRWRKPLSALVAQRAERQSLVLFALFMLSSTAFDGLRATQWWVAQFWQSAWIGEWVGRRPIYAYAELRPWYEAMEFLVLLASPFIYYGVYLLFLEMSRRLARSARPLRALALDFAYTLLPIALVYNLTHYFTLLSQGPKILSLLSDPFGWGWNLFGTRFLFGAPILPNVGLVWHAQVGLILLGHILSVYLAHLVALRVFATRRQAVLSQLPMLALMVLFTVVGLWILAQPITSIVSQ